MQDLGKANQKIQSVAKAEEGSQKTEDVKESETKEENQAEMLVYSGDGKPVWEEKESQMLGRA